jgi:hypothetical protein
MELQLRRKPRLYYGGTNTKSHSVLKFIIMKKNLMTIGFQHDYYYCHSSERTILIMFHSFSCRSHLEQRASFGVSVITHILRHTVGLVWTSDQPVAEASTYTGQHNI